MSEGISALMRALLAACVAALALGWLGYAAAFGFAAWAALAAAFAIGYGPHWRQPFVAGMLLLVFAVFSALLAGMVWLDDPEGQLRLIGGLPAATALLVYGIWPAGLLAGLLYVLAFDRWVLPPGALERVRAARDAAGDAEEA
jgi:hypothetical protein